MTEQQWQHALLDAISDPHWQPHPGFPGNGLAVYRNNYRVGLMDMLAVVYPIISQLLGAEFFQGLSREFVRATPSHSGNLHRYGAGFADFIAHFPHTADWPYLPDVARLEWAMHRGYYAADARAFDPAQLAAIPQQQWGELQLPTAPGLSLLATPWALSAIHAYHQPGAARQAFTVAQPEILLLWREQGRMQLQTIDAAQHAFLGALQQRQTLDQATAAALAFDPAFDLQSLLLQGLQHGWFCQEDTP